MIKIFESIGRIATKGKTDSIRKKLLNADIKTDSFIFVGINVIISCIISIFVCLLANSYFGIMYAILSTAIFVVVYYIVVTGIVSLVSDQRAKYIETILPDALLLMASNLRSGVPPDEALALSARAEFGFLADKIKTAGKMMATGATLQDAFQSMTENISSKIFEQTIELIIEGLNSGGELSTLLESTANDIRDMESIRKEVRSMVFVYALFIFIAACLIAPILYAVSIQLASVLSRLSQTIAVQFVTEKATAMNLTPTDISPDFLKMFAYVNLTITTAFGSLIVALINRGDEKYGLRYIPFFVGLALVLFFIAGLALQSFFGGIKVV